MRVDSTNDKAFSKYLRSVHITLSDVRICFSGIEDDGTLGKHGGHLRLKNNHHGDN